jgi:hypothetical protein
VSDSKLFEEGKGESFYVDSDGTLFTAAEGGGAPQKVFISGEGWAPYLTGFNPFVTTKVSEEKAKEIAANPGY